MKIDKLLDLTKDNFYLEETTYLKRIPETRFRKKLVEFYNHEFEEVRIMGSVLNAIYTEGKTTFYFSKRSLQKLIENDRKNLEDKGRPKIDLGKAGYKVNHFRQKLVEMFKGNNGFSLLKEASIKLKTPSVIEMDDDDLYDLMDELGEMTKRLRKSWSKSALDAINTIEKELMESQSKPSHESNPAPNPVPVQGSREDSILNESDSNESEAKSKIEVDLEVELSMDDDDWIYEQTQLIR